MSRLGEARTSLVQLNSILLNKRIRKYTKIAINKTLVEISMIYGAETWVINKRNQTK